MARAREESASGDTRQGVLRALSVTGAVITSAGIVLAGTFSALASLPLVAFAEVGLVIAFGVLLDTFLVRTVLVPALVLEIEGRVGGRPRFRAGAQPLARIGPRTARGYSSAGRALAWHARGRRFEPD